MSCRRAREQLEHCKFVVEQSVRDRRDPGNENRVQGRSRFGAAWCKSTHSPTVKSDGLRDESRSRFVIAISTEVLSIAMLCVVSIL